MFMDGKDLSGMMKSLTFYSVSFTKYTRNLNLILYALKSRNYERAYGLLKLLDLLDWFVSLNDDVVGGSDIDYRNVVECLK